MALDFPSSPTNGQQFSGYTWNSTLGVWQATSTSTAPFTISDTKPTNPTAGDAWWNSADGTLYLYYYDGNTYQWVEARAPITSDGYYSPNYIINGDFFINQRGLTSSGQTTNGYGFDRWLMNYSGGTVTYSAQTFTAGSAPVIGYEAKNFARTVTSGQSAAGDYSFLAQKIEDVRTFAGQTITISFWARAASGSPKVAVEMVPNMGTGGSPTALNGTYAGQVTLSTTWQRYSLTVAMPSLAGQVIGTDPNTSSIALYLWTSAGSSFNSRTGSMGTQAATIDFWGIQVETGSVATPFRRNANSLQGELAACQRYFYAITSAGGQIAVGGGRSGTNNTIFALTFPVQMRTSPAVTCPASWTAKQINGTGVPLSSTLNGYASSPYGSNIEMARTSGTWASELTVLLESVNSSLFFNAEL